MVDYDRIVALQAKAKELQETTKVQREDPSKAKEYATTTEHQLERGKQRHRCSTACDHLPTYLAHHVHRSRSRLAQTYPL